MPTIFLTKWQFGKQDRTIDETCLMSDLEKKNNAQSLTLQISLTISFSYGVYENTIIDAITWKQGTEIARFYHENREDNASTHSDSPIASCRQSDSRQVIFRHTRHDTGASDLWKPAEPLIINCSLCNR